MNETNILTAGTGAGITGVVLGWAAKKVLKLVAIILTVQFGFQAYLASQGLITVHWAELQAHFGGVTGINIRSGLPQWLAGFIETLPISGPLTLGFYYGFNKG